MTSTFRHDFNIPARLQQSRYRLPWSKSAGGYGPPFADLYPLPNFPFKHPLYHIWEQILFASFLSMFFSMTTQHSSIKMKKNSHFVPILSYLLQRVVQYTQELNTIKPLHSNYWNCYNNACFFWCKSTLVQNVITIVETIASTHKNISVWFSN